MAFRINIVIILLLFSLVLVLSSKSSGGSKKKKQGPPKLSENIDNNPFLQNSNKTEGLTYESNPFLSNKSQIVFSPSRIESVYDDTPTNNKRTKPNENHSVVSSNNANTPQVIDDKISVDISTKTKSELKCEEYAKQILGTTDVLYLVGSNTDVVQITNQKCKNTNRLVVGGTNASPGEFPHMVALGRRTAGGTFIFSCGGTLISPEWVLTAAHCTYGPKSPTDARIGLQNLYDNESGIRTTIHKIQRHPSHKPPAMYADIALVQLNTVVTFNDNIKPACLYQQYDTVPPQAWVSGWGVTEFGGEQSDQLQKALLEIVDNIACALRHNQSNAIPYGISPSMICAGDRRGGWTKDTCQGDSGGPLQIVHPKNICLFQVLGITSFGQGCAFVNTPGVYTRVSHYLNWIEDTVWP